MFIAIVGSRFAGKSTVEDYLISTKGFTPVCLTHSDVKHGHKTPKAHWHGLDAVDDGASSTLKLNPQPLLIPDKDNDLDHSGGSQSFLLLSPTSITSFSEKLRKPSRARPLLFSTSSQMLDYVTDNWRCNFVTTDLVYEDALQAFSKRPFFMLVSVDAPLLVRFQRSHRFVLLYLTGAPPISPVSIFPGSLEDFVREHDALLYGQNASSTSLDLLSKEYKESSSSLHSLRRLVTLNIVNWFATLPAFHTYLDELDLLNFDRLRPSWDTYFMTLASLASMRSNCMKRRVGAIVVRNNRIVATGYNGTPRGLRNCYEGGCPRCNGNESENDLCLCLHAEENALLEAGRERIGDGAILYCNTCPCIKCTTKIVQTGIKEVVYNLSYKVDDVSARVFEEAGVRLRRYAPP